MVDVINKTCCREGCSKRPSFGLAESRKAEFCSQHARNGMVNVVSKTCCREGCSKQPSFGLAGSRKAEFCSKHAGDGMVHVRSKTCCREGCSKRALLGMAGSRKAEFCSQHAGDGMINLRYGEKKRSVTCHFEEPVTRPKMVKVDIGAQESNDGGYSQWTRSREMRQFKQAERSKSSTTRKAKLAGMTGGLVPAQIVRSMTTARVMVFEGGTSVKSEMSVSQNRTCDLTATHLVVTASHDGGDRRPSS